ncbi:interleukin-12 subunit alpha [Parambassis ranga]|uniref:Interleukin-12 subunit alpha n=1 Tax=Parambassis ranga TaxID=210632 RepID=A0A6P7JH58_9TELE|nr:interleukin-12 subunit alpha-like [Parambassis ranga]
MAHCNLYFTSCVLLLLTLNWRASMSVPVPTLSAQDRAHCSQLFRKLLLNITGLRNSAVLCFGITSENVVLRSEAETVLACAPPQTQNSSCMMQRNSPFSETECLRNIMKDIAYYEAVIRSYLNATLRNTVEETALLMPTLEIIKSLKENCSLEPNGETSSSEEDVAVQVWGNNTFDNRNEMCKIMRGFHIRTITINRAMGYISSGDHRK